MYVDLNQIRLVMVFKIMVSNITTIDQNDSTKHGKQKRDMNS